MGEAVGGTEVLGYAAKDTSGHLSPFKFTRKYFPDSHNSLDSDMLMFVKEERASNTVSRESAEFVTCKCPEL